MKSELFAEILKFKAKYKKCRANCKDCTVKNTETLAKTIHYFRYDMITLLQELEEEVAEDKADAEPTAAKTIEEYAKKNKECRGLLKGVKFSRDKQAKACGELKDMLTRADASMTCLQKLKSEIDKVLKKQGKGAKPDKDIENLIKQINGDLKEINLIFAKAKKIPAINRDPDKEYKDETKRIATVKPSVSSAQKKFNTIYPNKLSSKAIKSNTGDFNKTFKAILGFADSAEKAAQKGDIKALTESFQNGQKQLQILEKTEQEYTKFNKKYSKQIKKASNSQEIKKTIKLFANKKSGANKRWEKTAEIIRNASK